MNSSLPQERGIWIRVGGRQGLVQGRKASFIYTFLVLLGMLAMMLINLFHARSNDIVINAESVVGVLILGLMVMGFGTGFSLIIGIGPAMLVGWISGVLLGACLSVPYIHNHRWNRIAVGLGVALVTALQANLMVLSRLEAGQGFEALATYAIFLAVPSVVYSATIIRLSDQLPALVQASLYQHETPVYPAYELEELS